MAQQRYQPRAAIQSQLTAVGDYLGLLGLIGLIGPIGPIGLIVLESDHYFHQVTIPQAYIPGRLF